MKPWILLPAIVLGLNAGVLCQTARAAEQGSRAKWQAAESPSKSRSGETQDDVAFRKAFARVLFGPSIAVTSSTREPVANNAPLDMGDQRSEIEKASPERVYAEAEIARQMLDLLAQAFGKSFKIRRQGTGTTGVGRGLQENILRSALDRDGFFDPDLSRHVISQTAAWMLVIWISGPSDDNVPDVLVHPIIGQERQQFKSEPMQLVLRWTERAREKLRRIPTLPRPGRWDFRPIVLDPDQGWAILYPKHLVTKSDYDLKDLPKMLWLINSSSGQVVPVK